MKFQLPLSTARLYLKKESLHDFEGFFEMSKDPAVMKYIGDGSIFHWTKQVALEKFRTGIESDSNSHPGCLAVYSKSPERYLGRCEIRHSKFLDHVELGYRFCRGNWGNGYATEAAAAVLKTAFRTSNIDSILACCHPDNGASIRVLEKIGFSGYGSRYSRASERDIFIYRIHRSIITNNPPH